MDVQGQFRETDISRIVEIIFAIVELYYTRCSAVHIHEFDISSGCYLSCLELDWNGQEIDVSRCVHNYDRILLTHLLVLAFRWKFISNPFWCPRHLLREQLA